MVLSTYGDGLASPDLRAAQQQALLSCFLYGHRRDLCQRVFQGHPDWSLLVWEADDATTVPNFFAGRQDDRFFIVITGTTNIRQMIGNVMGYVALPYQYDSAVMANSFWQIMWQTIEPQLREALRDIGPTSTVHVSGHSYGAAVALLVAIDWARKHGPSKVEYMGFGCPNVLTGNYTGPLPNNRYRFSGLKDVVAILPPLGSGLSNLRWNNVLPYFSGKLAWDGYGAEYLLSPEGRFLDPANNSRIIPVSLEACLNDGFATHSMKEYLRRITLRRKMG